METTVSVVRLKQSYQALMLIRADIPRSLRQGAPQWEIDAMLAAEKMAAEEFRILKIAADMESEEIQAMNNDAETRGRRARSA